MAVRKRRERLDRMDAELIRETLQTPGWKKIRDRLWVTLARKRKELEKDQSELETAKLRGFIEGLSTAESIPEILIKEGSAAPALDHRRGEEREL